MCLRNKNKKSLEQVAYEYGITISKEIVSNFFLEYEIDQKNIDELLNNLENCKSINYPLKCGTCNAILI